MQALNLMNDDELWKVEKIVDRIKIRENDIWYQIKWAEWDDEYNQWFLEDELNNATEFKNKFNENVKAFKRRRRR